MAYFKVDTARLTQVSDDLLSVINQCNSVRNDVRQAAQGLTGNSATIKLAKVKIENRASELMKEIFTLNQMRILLMSLVDAYENVERKIIDNLDSNRISNEEAREIVFGTEDGMYGGDQGHPLKEKDPEIRRQYRDLIEKNIGRKLTDAEFEAFLKRMNSEGCGYVAMVNAMMVYFISHPDAFEKAGFNFPLYDKDGNPNYDMMLVDFYSKTDNVDEEGYFDILQDYDSKVDGDRDYYDYWSDTSGYGLTDDDIKNHVERYMDEHGLDVNAETGVKVTPESYQSIVNSGKTVTIAYRNGIIYDANNKPHVINGGHAMTVTGVTEDGRFIVSSWGNVYYLDPNENTGMNTSMTFLTFDNNL